MCQHDILQTEKINVQIVQQGHDRFTTVPFKQGRFQDLRHGGGDKNVSPP